MTARTRLTLHQLDGRDLPSTVAGTVEPPAGYASGPTAYQQASDPGVPDSPPVVVGNTTVSVVVPVDANAAPADDRPWNPTPAQADEIIALDAQSREIDVRLAENAAATARLQNQIDGWNVALGVLRDDLAKANDDLRETARAYNTFSRENPRWYNSDPATISVGYNLLIKGQAARARAEAIAASIARIEGLSGNAQQRIDALVHQDSDLVRIKAEIDQRIKDIGNSARQGVPSPAFPWSFTLPPRLTTDADFLDLTNQYYLPGHC